MKYEAPSDTYSTKTSSFNMFQPSLGCIVKCVFTRSVLLLFRLALYYYTILLLLLVSDLKVVKLLLLSLYQCDRYCTNSLTNTNMSIYTTTNLFLLPSQAAIIIWTLNAAVLCYEVTIF